MSSNIKFELQGVNNLLDKMVLLKMKPADRKRFINNVSRRVGSNMRKNIRSHKNVFGGNLNPLSKRQKKNRKHRKRILWQKKQLFTKFNSDKSEASHEWRDAFSGAVARRHQDGSAQTVTCKSYIAQHKKHAENELCTKEQAKKLKSLGFKKGGRGRKISSQKWMRENMSAAQAGFLIKKLENRDDAPNNWSVKVPKRETFGLSEKEKDDAIQHEINIFINRINHKK